MNRLGLVARVLLVTVLGVGVVACSGTGKPSGNTSDLFKVGGTVVGLTGDGLILEINSSETVSVTQDGSFSFPTGLSAGSGFDVRVKVQPSNQACTVSGGKGVVATGAVSTITVNCRRNTYTIGGRVSGLMGSGLILTLGSGETVPVRSNGTFAFPTPVRAGTPFEVSVVSQPVQPSQTCTVTGGAGMVVGEDVNSIEVACELRRFTVGGTVTGLEGTGLVLTNNGRDDFTVTQDGAFTFETPVDSGATYAVAVLTQPVNRSQTCTVMQGSGTMQGAAVTNVAVTCVTNSYVVSGAVGNLLGTGLVLVNNGEELPITNAAFAFSMKVKSGDTYHVTIKSSPVGPAQDCTITNGTGTVTGFDVTDVWIPCTAKRWSVGGTITGLAGSGLVLHHSSGEEISPTADGAFVFPTGQVTGSSYTVTIKTQPTNPPQQCTINGGTGVVQAGDVKSILVNCTTLIPIAGTVSGLVGAGLKLKNSNGEEVAVSANGSFAFPTPMSRGAAYSVSIVRQPTSPSQTCTVTNGAGSASPGVNVSVTCETNKYTLGGAVTGLSGTGLVLHNGSDELSVNVNGSFTLPSLVTSGQTYDVKVKTQPSSPSQTCTVTNGAGAMGATAVTSVSVLCKTNTFPVQGSVTGLVGSGLTLRLNTGEDLPITGNTTFAFNQTVASGSTYTVSVSSQPTAPNQTCVVSNATGAVGAAPVVVSVACTTNLYSIGGTVVGLKGQGLVLVNNFTDDLPIAADGTFQFPTKMNSTGTYSVTVSAQPLYPTQTCTVSGGVGSAVNAAVSSIVVNCTTNQYSIGGTVSGLAGQGLVLELNRSQIATISANGAFSFSTPLPSGSEYSVSVPVQPQGPVQSCIITGGSGIVGGTNVNSIAVQCTTTSYPVFVTVTGLAGTGLVLKNGTENLPVSANMTVQFTQLVQSGGSYAVTVATQPTNLPQTCTVSNGTGVVVSAAATVTVNCVTNKYTVGGRVEGLAPSSSVVLRDQFGTELTLTASGLQPTSTPFTFATPVEAGSTYAVSVLTQPSQPSQTCSISGSSGTGTMGGANVTNVVVNCVTNNFRVRASVQGLAAGDSIILENNGSDTLTFNTSGMLSFLTPIPSGGTYQVTIDTQPTTQVCRVIQGTGTVADGDVTVVVSCSTLYYLGGQVNGLEGSGLTLKNNGGDEIWVEANGAFTFPTPMLIGTAFAVTVGTGPSFPTQTCTIVSGTGAMGNTDVTNVAVNCTTNKYMIGGTITGLTSGSSVVLLNNNADPQTLVGGTSPTFTFSTPVLSGATYNVTVGTQPGPALTCAVTAGTGVVTNANITSVKVNCTPNYSVGGTISGLAGNNLRIALATDPTNAAVVSSPLTSFTLPKTLPNGTSYSLSVTAQPKGMVQTCTVSANGSGTVNAANVTNVTVTCSPVTAINYTQSLFTVDGVNVTTSPAGIPDSPKLDCTTTNPGKMLVSEIDVPASPFAVRSAKVTLTGLKHTFAGDLSVIVEQQVSQGSGVIISAVRPMFDRPGRVSATPSCGSSADLSGTYSFEDGGPKLSSSYAPGSYSATGTDDVILILNEAANAGFATPTPKGTWRLKIVDNNQYDVGTITSWTLQLMP